MPREAPEIRLIRETLEGVLHPATASTVLFEAITAQGGVVPSTHAEIMQLITGPLAEGLLQRLGEDTASSVLDQLQLMMRAIAPSEPRAVRKRPSRHEEVTLNLELTFETLPVFVLASSRAFANQLAAALGPDIMSAVFADSAATLRKRVEQVPPAFVLIDASDFPAIEPDELARQLLELPSEVVKAIWGTDLPYGMSTLDAAQKVELALTPFDRAEGIEPLMDMIRSRRASR